jgi:hypothetical protein
MAATVGCASQPSELQQAILRARHAEWSANECFRDTMLVAVEHSANCLSAVRMLRSDQLSETCNENSGLHCRQLSQRLERASLYYWRAVAESLYIYGKPKEFDPVKRGSLFGSAQFYDVDLLAQAFQNCLAAETKLQAAELERDRFTVQGRILPALTVKRRELARGQLCIREQPFESDAGWLDN